MLGSTSQRNHRDTIKSHTLLMIHSLSVHLIHVHDFRGRNYLQLNPVYVLVMKREDISHRVPKMTTKRVQYVICVPVGFRVKFTLHRVYETKS